MVFFGPDPSALFAQERGSIYPEDFNAYLLIGGNGRGTVYSGKIEMVLGDTELCPWDMGTFGSLTTRMFGPALRAAAADARTVLLHLAAKKLDVPQAALAVNDGVVFVAADPARRISYGELAQGAKIARAVGERAALRAVSEFREMGKSPQRLDAHEKVTGAAKYAADIRLPGMLYARILRPPAPCAGLARLATAAAAKLPGVKLIRRDGLVAVLHADPEAAAAALERIEVEGRYTDSWWQAPQFGACHHENAAFCRQISTEIDRRQHQFHAGR